ncbi:MAG: sulfatase-like hydrolase/transferase [Roseomonas sp.]|nr:sulfatase-like hydrolase/transferase [Roseomonas sp.]
MSNQGQGRSRRGLLLGGPAGLTAGALPRGAPLAQAQPRPAAPAQPPAAAPAAAQGRPNILVIFSDDVGWANISVYNMGMMGYRTPHIDRIAREGAMFTDHYAENSCTAGRSAFITGQRPCPTSSPSWPAPSRGRRSCT